MGTGLLIAEADEALRWIYERQSSLLGFQVETAADGLECYSKVRACSPDALVIDEELPWGGGDGVLACLREDSDPATAPAIFVTGDDPPEVLSGRYGIPPAHCFQKPFRLKALLEVVCTVIAADGPFPTQADTTQDDNRVLPPFTARPLPCRSAEV